MTSSDLTSDSSSRPWAGLRRWGAWAAAALGGLAYSLLAYGQMHGQTSVLDEGLYLYKGLLFARGAYWPFQDFGLLTNHMPLSFLIPGWVQVIFGPGLATGRALAWAVSLLMVVGLWMATRRMAGPWWAAGVVWLVVLNAGWLKIYSQAISQGLIACMLVWTAALGVGQGRKLWQTTIAAVIAGAMGMTRINMFPVILLYVPYVYWAHGRKAGHAALLGGGGFLVIGHAIFWPGILKLWATWLPSAITPFLNAFRDHAGGAPAWQVLLTPSAKLGILEDSLRLHLASVAGIIWAWLVAPTSSRGMQRHRLLAVTFLTTLFAVLFVLHIVATLGGTYCPFCLKNYLAFFSPIGLIVLAIAAAHWLPLTGPLRRSFSLLALFLLPWTLGFSLGRPLSLKIAATELPRVSGSTILPGTAEFGSMVSQKFGLVETALLDRLDLLQAIGLTVFALACIALFARARRQSGTGGLLPPTVRLLSIATAFAIATGTLSLGSGYHTYDCGRDVIASQTAVGADLAAKIPPGSTIYWGSGGRSPLPFLYLRQTAIFPPQLNGVYAYRFGGDAAELPRLGSWNPQLASTWLSESDIVLVQAQDLEGTLVHSLDPQDFDQISPSPPSDPCQPNSYYLIFRRVSTGPLPP